MFQIRVRRLLAVRHSSLSKLDVTCRYLHIEACLRSALSREHRVFYIAKFAEATYVLHAFEKRSRKTLRQDLEIAKSRFRLLLRARGEQGG